MTLVYLSRITEIPRDVRQVMETYEKGGHMYHATMPTDALVKLRDTMIEMRVSWTR
jgi:hypothetical protein